MPAAAIAGVAAVGGSVLSASANKKAAGKAADASLAAAESNNKLAREIYGQNRDILSPFVQRGDVAGQYLNAFLGLPGAPAPQTTPQQNAFGSLPGNYVNIPGIGMVALPGIISGYGGGTFNIDGTQATPVQPSVTQGDAQNAFRGFIENSDYGFQFGEGSNALNSGYAGAGTLQSGAAMKELERFRQNLQSGYRGEYLGYLGNQQGVGLGAGSALAGVGQNYAGMVSANNTNAANAAANAALVRGQNNPFAAGLGALSGTILGRGW